MLAALRRRTGRCRQLAPLLGQAAFGLSASAPGDRDPTPGVDFGFARVAEDAKARLIGDLFGRVAPRYDFMNDLMSGGLHRLWKDRLVARLGPFPGMRHLDVAGGTGDVAFRVLDAIRAAEARRARSVAVKGSVVVCDLTPEMLEAGKRRAANRRIDQGLEWVQGDAEALPLEDDSVDGYTVAFGIRNVTHIDRALSEALRVLKPGGHFLCLEFSKVEGRALAQLYDAYSFNVIPMLGRWVAGDEGSYRYLVESIRRFPPQDEFAGMIKGAGFGCVSYENLMAGVVAIHSGFKL
ncbi:unnamed protein product [Ostreobium quekettii]|uniref:2-methoxy-6-polyprenyl-1,4-benzoquinol methylase, mitochondrial n=1 Tax=Ostreobium quekettii TaxID=121088 RepID=A0A8S1IQH2_9CHLO|nr:unnamed protein product [Ostreobium quekettii]|eukprot:evm.model.scf_1966.3 EVM.evm.TU.scf_1966.3   scf_1966:12331-13903(+)